MSLQSKKLIIAVLGLLFLASLVFVQREEVLRREREAGLARAPIAVPESSLQCVDCHRQSSAGIIDHWAGSTHAERGIARRMSTLRRWRPAVDRFRRHPGNRPAAALIPP
jgi:hypothetical protein